MQAALPLNVCIGLVYRLWLSKGLYLCGMRGCLISVRAFRGGVVIQKPTFIDLSN